MRKIYWATIAVVPTIVLILTLRHLNMRSSTERPVGWPDGQQTYSKEVNSLYRPGDSGGTRAGILDRKQKPRYSFPIPMKQEAQSPPFAREAISMANALRPQHVRWLDIFQDVARVRDENPTDPGLELFWDFVFYDEKGDVFCAFRRHMPKETPLHDNP